MRACNVEYGSACKPRRASPEAHIYFVALLTKDLGHLLRPAPGSKEYNESVMQASAAMSAAGIDYMELGYIPFDELLKKIKAG